ncbi:MAG: nuclear transport factor 2 family protein [Burkholderiaceae bacterium]
MSDASVFAQITELDEARQRATLAKDIDSVAGIIGATLRYVHGSGTDEDRDLYLQRLREGFYDYRGLKVSRREFRRFGETVLVHGDIAIHVVVNGNEKNFVSRYLQVWADEGGAWQMIAWQSTPMPSA